ncbi:hypothetical protein H5410_051485, partial [Solanum commersonii]
SFFLDKHSGKKCIMIAPRELVISDSDNPYSWKWDKRLDSSLHSNLYSNLARQRKAWYFKTSYAVEEKNQQEQLVTSHIDKEKELHLQLLSHDQDVKNPINMSVDKGSRAMMAKSNSQMSITKIGKMVFMHCHSSRQVQIENAYHV